MPETTTTTDQRELERLHILGTLREHGPMTGLEVVEIANAECIHTAFDGLPDIGKRGVGQKLNALSLRGLADGELPPDRSPMRWRITTIGRDYLEAGLNRLDGHVITRTAVTVVTVEQHAVVLEALTDSASTVAELRRVLQSIAPYATVAAADSMVNALGKTAADALAALDGGDRA